MTENHWVDLVSYASGFEADIMVARLEAEGIPALRDNHDSTGIFGPGFQGATAFGVTVRVPLDCLDDARLLLTEIAAYDLPEDEADTLDESAP